MGYVLFCAALFPDSLSWGSPSLSSWVQGMPQLHEQKGRGLRASRNPPALKYQCPSAGKPTQGHLSLVVCDQLQIKKKVKFD